MAVGWKVGKNPRVLTIRDPETRGIWGVAWRRSERFLDLLLGHRFSGFRRRTRWLRGFGPCVENLRGHEDFDWPGTWRLLDLPPRRPDLVHCHNLHGGYFDLRALPWLSRQVPVVLTLHDAWLLAGHCVHSLGCERWRDGCLKCPNLKVQPPLMRDGAAYNWIRKRDIFRRSRVYVSTPSRWLMDRAKRSILSPAIVGERVIPNGVDLSVFTPGDKDSARKRLGLPSEANILLFSANGIRRNPWKDYSMLRSSLRGVAKALRGRLILVALGERGPPERAGGVEVRFVPYQRDPEVVACYNQAADLYVHPARAESFSLTIVEAMACGKPVVATSVGGIPEVVDDGETGFLVPENDVKAMEERIRTLLEEENLLASMGKRGMEKARQRYDVKEQIRQYLRWFDDILSNWSEEKEGRV